MNNKKITDLSFAQKVKILQIYHEIEGLDSTLGYLDYAFYQLNFIVSKPKFKFLLFYMLVSIIAFNEKAYFYYCILLLDCINYESTLQNVLKSITNNAKPLILTGILGLIMIFMFSFAGFSWIPADFYMSDIGDSSVHENVCNSLI